MEQIEKGRVEAAVWREGTGDGRGRGCMRGCTRGCMRGAVDVWRVRHDGRTDRQTDKTFLEIPPPPPSGRGGGGFFIHQMSTQRAGRVGHKNQTKRQEGVWGCRRADSGQCLKWRMAPPACIPAASWSSCCGAERGQCRWMQTSCCESILSGAVASVHPVITLNSCSDPSTGRTCFAGNTSKSRCTCFVGEQ